MLTSRYIGFTLIASTCYLSDVASGSDKLPSPGSDGGLKNVALGKKYTLSPQPDYRFSTGSSDGTDLTDGKTIAENKSLWTEQGTVGWTSKRGAIYVTIDLESATEIRGAAFSTCAGRADIKWPNHIYIFSSLDQTEWRYVGDLLDFAKRKQPFPEVDADGKGVNDAHFTIQSTDLPPSIGRYVTLAICGAPYVFTDEIKLFGGDSSDTAINQNLPRIESEGGLKTYIDDLLTTAGVSRRLNSDISTLRGDISQAKIPVTEKTALNEKLAAIENDVSKMAPVSAENFKAIMPYHPLQSEILAVQAELWRATGIEIPFIWKTNRFQRVPFIHRPGFGEEKPLALQFRMLKGEARSDSFLISNAAAEPVEFSLQFSEIPNQLSDRIPTATTLSRTLWTDTATGVPVCNALIPVRPDGDTYSIPVPAGVTQRVWITIDSETLSQGVHNASLVIKSGSTSKILPVQISISNVRKREPSLKVGFWDYCNNNTSYGLSPSNRDSAIRSMESLYTNAPVASAAVLPWPNDNAFDAEGALKSPLSFAEFDRWVTKIWPGKENYIIFLATGQKFAGKPVGNPEFASRITSWLKAIENHIHELGLKPSQFILETVDEPHSNEQAETMIAWTRIIRAAAPEFRIITDPTWVRPDQVELQEALTGADIISPNTQLFQKGGAAAAEYYAKRQAAGQELWFYECEGPTRPADPAKYYRKQSWFAFLHNARGITFWSFGDTGNRPTSWNEYLCGGKQCEPGFIGLNEVTDSIHLHAIREGVQDYAALELLRDELASCSNPALVAKGKAFFENKIKSIGELSLGFDKLSDIGKSILTPSPDGKILDDLRDECLDLLEAVRESKSSRQKNANVSNK